MLWNSKKFLIAPSTSTWVNSCTNWQPPWPPFEHTPISSCGIHILFWLRSNKSQWSTTENKEVIKNKLLEVPAKQGVCYRDKKCLVFWYWEHGSKSWWGYFHKRRPFLFSYFIGIAITVFQSIFYTKNENIDFEEKKHTERPGDYSFFWH